MRKDERTDDMVEEMNNSGLETVNCNQAVQKKNEKTLRIACCMQTSRLEYEMSLSKSLQR
jgi:hypothetical protein